MTPQKVIQSKQGTVDANGNCTLTFDPPPMGSTLTGTITISNAPAGTVWSIQSNGSEIDVATGSASIGSIQARTNETITAVANPGGMIPGTVIRASFVANLTDDTVTPLITPSHDTINNLAGYARLVNNSAGAVNPIIVNLLPLDRCLVILMNRGIGAPSLASAVGNNTGIDWAPFASVHAGAAAGAALVTLPVYGSIDSQITLTFSTVTAKWILALPDDRSLGNAQPILAQIVDASKTILGSYANPLVVKPADSQIDPWGVANCFPAANQTNVQLVAAPSAGNVWEVASLSIFASGQPTAAGNILIARATSGGDSWGTAFKSGETVRDHSDARWTTSEGLVVNNGLNVSIGVALICRQIPQNLV